MKVSRANITDSSATSCILSFVDDLDPCSSYPSSSGDGQSQPKKSRGAELFTATFSSSFKDFDELSDNRQRVVSQPLVEMMNQFLEKGKYSLSFNH